MDAKKYLQRINYQGPLNTEPLTLRNLCDCHSRAVPFDVLDMFGGTRKVLDMEKIYNDIVVKKRGGFCYENNGLFSWLLAQVGFKVEILQGQAYLKDQQIFQPEFDHMALMVTCCNGEQWLTDVGWGGTSFVLPLKFEEMLEQPQRNGAYRLRKLDQEGNTYLVEKVEKQVLREDEERKEHGQKKWEIMYRFHIKPRKLSDFDKMFAYQQDSETSFLKHNSLCCIQTTAGLTYTWGYSLNRKTYIDPYTEIKMNPYVAENAEELKEILKEEMGLEIDFNLQVESRNHKQEK